MPRIRHTLTIRSAILASALVVASSLLLCSCETTPTQSDAKTQQTLAPTNTSTTGVKKYPLTVCIVTDNALGSMGDTIYMDYEGQEVAFCCKPCIKMFNADPQKFLAKLPPATP